MQKTVPWPVLPFTIPTAIARHHSSCRWFLRIIMNRLRISSLSNGLLGKNTMVPNSLKPYSSATYRSGYNEKKIKENLNRLLEHGRIQGSSCLLLSVLWAVCVFLKASSSGISTSAILTMSGKGSLIDDGTGNGTRAEFVSLTCRNRPWFNKFGSNRC